jgi:integrase
VLIHPAIVTGHIQNVDHRLMVKRKNLILAGGERYATLTDANGLPDFWVTLFVTVMLRPSHKQNAILNILQDFAHFRIWEEITQRDVLSEFGEGRFLSNTDVTALRDHCAFESRSLRKWLNVSSQKSVVKFSRSKAIKSGQFRGVSKAHQSNRMTHIASYLAFTARAILRQRPTFSDLDTAISDMEARILRQRPRVTGRSSNNDPEDKAPPPKAFESLMKTIEVDSPNNPYKNQNIRFRNALMFKVMYETGIRSGELLSLYVDDVMLSENGAKINIERRHDDPYDTRAHQPVVKTLGRKIPIPSLLAEQLREYIMQVRARIPGTGGHPLLFVTHHAARAHQGAPISDSAFRHRILKRAVEGNSELFEEITRHGFRHTFNYKISKLIDENNERAKHDAKIKPISEQEEIQIRKYLNGWRSDGSAATYNLRHTKETADTLLREDAQAQLKHIKLNRDEL